MWSAYLFKVTTGQIGPRLEYESLSWSIELNGTESISLGLMKSDLPNVDLSHWLAPWWAGVVLFWNDTPIVAGPITTRPNETPTTVSVNCGGIRSILANRTVTPYENNPKRLAESEIWEVDYSLGTIAKHAVIHSMDKPGAALPLSFPIDDQKGYDEKIPPGLPPCTNDDGSGPNPCYWDAQTQGDKQGQSFAKIDDRIIYDSPGDHQRVFLGFDIQNNVTDDVLTKLSNVTNGPDIMFKPRLVRDNQLTFDMYYGTEADPRISQKIIPVWDTVPERSQVTDMSIIYTGTYQTSRVYSLGAGQDKSLLITIHQDYGPINDGFPLLEKVINVGSSDKVNIVRGHGDAELARHEDALLEIQMTVRGDNPDLPFGSFWPGDLAHIYTKGWIGLPDGLTKMRILSLTGDDSANVKISLQKEDKFLKTQQ